MGGHAVSYTHLDVYKRQTDTYVIDVHDSADALGALMVVLAIDAEKCSRN